MFEKYIIILIFNIDNLDTKRKPQFIKLRFSFCISKKQVDIVEKNEYKKWAIIDIKRVKFIAIYFRVPVPMKCEDCVKIHFWKPGTGTV